MKHNGSALMITLWVLVLLTVLSVHTAHVVSLGMKLSSYSCAKVRASAAAQVGVWTAVDCLLADPDQTVDGPQDAWAHNSELFEKITVEQDQCEVSYPVPGGEERTFGVRDEERKINLNTASLEVLTSLFRQHEIAKPEVCAAKLAIWRSEDRNDDVSWDAEYECKSAPLSVIEELALIPGMTGEAVQRLKEDVTLHGDGKINFNTADDRVLLVLCMGSAGGYNARFAESLFEKIRLRRLDGRSFGASQDIGVQPEGEEETNIYNRFLATIAFSSRNFLIESTGTSGTIKGTIRAIYDRQNKKFVSWHER